MIYDSSNPLQKAQAVEKLNFFISKGKTIELKESFLKEAFHKTAISI